MLSFPDLISALTSLCFQIFKKKKKNLRCLSFAEENLGKGFGEWGTKGELEAFRGWSGGDSGVAMRVTNDLARGLRCELSYYYKQKCSREESFILLL